MNNSTNSTNNSNAAFWKKAKESPTWGEIEAIVRMLPCFSQESPDSIQETVKGFYYDLYYQTNNRAALDANLTDVFSRRFYESRFVNQVVDKVMSSPKNQQMIWTILSPLFGKVMKEKNIVVIGSEKAIRDHLSKPRTDQVSRTRLLNVLLNRYMATNTVQDAFKKLLAIKPPQNTPQNLLMNKNVKVNTTGTGSSSNNATVAPPGFQEGNMFPLEEEKPIPVEGGAKRKKRQKMRELLKAKTVEQLRRLMRKAGKKCSRKGVALRKGQMISALMRS
jgi:hypothetical protein